MSKIFELFGYRLDQWSEQAAENLSRANCPFMQKTCDGGGNRYSSATNLMLKEELAFSFPNINEVQAGVCSIVPREGQEPWIVCPRRLLSLKEGENQSNTQTNAMREIKRVSELEKNKRYKVWSEVKMKVLTKNEDDENKTFDYTFDYVIAAVGRKALIDLQASLEMPISKIKKIATENGFTLGFNDSGEFIDDFPTDPVIIIEIMTSSTSGGNKKNRSQIAMAFEDAVLHGLNHTAPGINYRQVWARMASQLIVKSQVGMAWGGKTIWLLQDVLASYISTSTALNLSKFIAENSSEVNILAFGYGDSRAGSSALIDLPSFTFYAGKIGGNESNNDGDGFLDIVKIGAAPPKDLLWKSLFNKKCAGIITG